MLADVDAAAGSSDEHDTHEHTHVLRFSVKLRNQQFEETPFVWHIRGGAKTIDLADDLCQMLDDVDREFLDRILFIRVDIRMTLSGTGKVSKRKPWRTLSLQRILLKVSSETLFFC